MISESEMGLKLSSQSQAPKGHEGWLADCLRTMER